MKRKAILIVHGFAGGTYDEEYLANQLEFIKEFDVFNFTLPGHESRSDKATRTDWLNSARNHVEMLIDNGYKDIYLIGHSMGGVIVSKIASEYKEVKKVVLAAPAFQYLNSEQEKFDVKNFINLIKINVKDYSKEEIFSRFLKMPSNSIKEFMSIVKENYDSPYDIDKPILIIHGKKDKLVPLTSSLYVFNTVKSTHKELLLVKDVNHDVFNNKKQQLIVNEIIKFYKNNHLKKNYINKKEI